jgi:mannose/fructose/N-acetylgalactosamine-specific phosphotransferase system component IID
MVLAIGMQILIATLILACLLFILMPAMTIYLTLIMYTTVAIAYRDGRAKLNEPTKTEFAA